MGAETKILIVEDDRTTAKVLELQIGNLGYAVVGSARTANEAIRMVRTHDPDLVLMDINLGRGGDGINTAELVRREHGIPVVYVTAYADDQTLERAKKTLPFGYVNKPIRPADLRTAISLAIDQAARIEEEAAAYQPANDAWHMQLSCAADGELARLTQAERDALKSGGHETLEQFLPADHGRLVQNCVNARREQHVTTRAGGRVYAWEYRAMKRGKSVRIRATEITAQAQLIMENVQQATLCEALDHLATGVVFVNENLKVFHRNQSAEQILARGSDLLIREGQLCCRRPERTAQLQRLVLQDRANTYTLERGASQPPLHLLVSPLHSQNDNYGRNLPTAIVYIFEAVKNSQRIEDVIRMLYNLSPREARFAAKLVLNPELKDAAHAMGITYNTARTHLKRIYAKTNVNRLSTLVHMIVTGPVGLLIHATE
ncbi:MAG: response regulator [Gammaproteobacteria bacterium]|nr:response regulator [Gammaproteobacteria bacterium]